MLQDLLWLASAKQQYNIQRSAGMAGLMGFLSLFFIVWKWDEWFYPVFQKLGLVDMAHRIGLVSELTALTALSVLLLIALVSFFLALITFVFLFAIGTFFAIGNTKRGLTIISYGILVLFAPIILPVGLYFHLKDKKAKKKDLENGIIHPTTMENKYKSDKLLKPLWVNLQGDFETVRMFQLFQKQLKREGNKSSLLYNGMSTMVSEVMEQKKTLHKYLNRAVASVSDDRKWLIAHNDNNSNTPKNDDHTYYLLFPNPLPAYASKNFLDDCYAEDSVVQIMPDYLHRSPFLYNFLILNGNHENERYKTEPLYVPAIEIDFVWNGFEIVPQIKENAQIQSLSTQHLDVYHMESEQIISFFEKVSSREDVQTAIKEAHIALYLIPAAYDVSELTLYNQYVQATPNAHAFGPLYQADVQERIVQYAKVGKPWAIKWLATDI